MCHIPYTYTYTYTLQPIPALGPYWCAMDLEAIALSSCMSDPALISVPTLIDATIAAANVLSIDSYVWYGMVWYGIHTLSCVDRTI